MWWKCRRPALVTCGRPDIGSGGAANTSGLEDVGSLSAAATIGCRIAGNKLDPIGITTSVTGSVELN